MRQRETSFVTLSPTSCVGGTLDPNATLALVHATPFASSTEPTLTLAFTSQKKWPPNPWILRPADAAAAAPVDASTPARTDDISNVSGYALCNADAAADSLATFTVYQIYALDGASAVNLPQPLDTNSYYDARITAECALAAGVDSGPTLILHDTTPSEDACQVLLLSGGSGTDALPPTHDDFSNRVEAISWGGESISLPAVPAGTLVSVVALRQPSTCTAPTHAELACGPPAPPLLPRPAPPSAPPPSSPVHLSAPFPFASVICASFASAVALLVLTCAVSRRLDDRRRAGKGSAGRPTAATPALDARTSATARSRASGADCSRGEPEAEAASVSPGEVDLYEEHDAAVDVRLREWAAARDLVQLLASLDECPVGVAREWALMERVSLNARSKPRDVTRAYFQVVKALHSDAHASAGLKLLARERTECAELLKLLNAAHGDASWKRYWDREPAL